MFVEITWPLLITLGAHILISSTGPPDFPRGEKKDVFAQHTIFLETLTFVGHFFLTPCKIKSAYRGFVQFVCMPKICLTSWFQWCINIGKTPFLLNFTGLRFSPNIHVVTLKELLNLFNCAVNSQAFVFLEHTKLFSPVIGIPCGQIHLTPSQIFAQLYWIRRTFRLLKWD